MLTVKQIYDLGIKLGMQFAGHMSSDSLGMNLYLDELEKKGAEVIPCSGLIRVSRDELV